MLHSFVNIVNCCREQNSCTIWRALKSVIEGRNVASYCNFLKSFVESNSVAHYGKSLKSF